MLQKYSDSKGGQAPAIHRTLDDPRYTLLERSTRAIHLHTALAFYAMIEFFAVTGSAYFGSASYHHIIGLNSLQAKPAYLLAAITIAILVLVISVAFRNFVAFRRQTRHIFLWRGLGAVAFAFSIFLTILFFTQSAEDYSRGSLVFQIISVGLTVATTRAIFNSWLQSATAANQIEARRVALIGEDVHCTRFASRLKSGGVQTVGSFRFPRVVSNGAIRELVAKLRIFRADDVIVLAPNDVLPTIFNFTASLAELPLGIHVVPVDALNSLASLQIAEFDNLQTIQVYRPPLSLFELCVKRAFDFILALVGLVMLSPLFLIVSIAIKFDTQGPVFFRNTRHGFNNEKIRILKFRSMTTTEDGAKFTQATKDDPRVTSIGRILRRTNIDELPQLINVLRGEMSLVGPRPHATAHNELFSDIIAPFSRRHNVKPGITGWAQVNGFRGETDVLEKMQRRIEYDLYYIDNWSFLFDLKIMFMTLFSKRAYLNAY